MTHTVLVTGVSRHIGARVASVLAADPDINRVIGVDTVPPPSLTRDGGVSLGRTEFVRVDLRSPDIAQVIAAADIDTVVHMSLVSAPSQERAAGRHERAQRHRHHAAARCLPAVGDGAACGGALDHRRLRLVAARPGGVHRGRRAARGRRATATPRTRSRSRATCAASPGAAPTWPCRMLRFANFMGPGVDSPLTRYFTQPVLPTVFGFDPRLQFVHEDDAVEVLRRMATEDHPGTFNVAGDGVLLLSQCARRAGRPSLPLPSPGLPPAGRPRAAARPRRLLARAAPPDESRPGGRLHPAGRRAGLEAEVHHRRGLRRLPPLARPGRLPPRP